MQFVPNGDFILSCSRDRSIKLWELATGFCTRTFSGHTDWVRALAINKDGTVFASCSNDETVMVWAIENVNALQVLAGHENVVETVAFATEGVA